MCVKQTDSLSVHHANIQLYYITGMYNVHDVQSAPSKASSNFNPCTCNML